MEIVAHLSLAEEEESNIGSTLFPSLFFRFCQRFWSACLWTDSGLSGGYAALLDPCQFAYRGNHSTQTCIIRMFDEVTLTADLRIVTVSIFFDFSKAFDRVDSLSLLNKLRALNFSDSVLRWLYSYLTGRTQRVKDGATSTIVSPTLDECSSGFSARAAALHTLFVRLQTRATANTLQI